jgi:hypothetical protein
LKSDLTGSLGGSKKGGGGASFDDMNAAEDAKNTARSVWETQAEEYGGADADPKAQRVYRQKGPVLDQILDLNQMLSEELLGRGADKTGYSDTLRLLVSALTEPGSVKQHMGKDWVGEYPGGRKYKISKGDYYIQTQQFPTPRPISEATKRMFDNTIGTVNKQALPDQSPPLWSSTPPPGALPISP